MTGRPPDAHAWAGAIRILYPDTSGITACDDPDDIYDSEFRRFARLRPIHRCILRELARRQAAEARLARGQT
jgi:hypothetical protein